MPVLIKEFHDIQTIIECRFTLKRRVRDMIITYSHFGHFLENIKLTAVISEEVINKEKDNTLGNRQRNGILERFENEDRGIGWKVT